MDNSVHLVNGLSRSGQRVLDASVVQLFGDEGMRCNTVALKRRNVPAIDETYGLFRLWTEEYLTESYRYFFLI